MSDTTNSTTSTTTSANSSAATTDPAATADTVADATEPDSENPANWTVAPDKQNTGTKRKGPVERLAKPIARLVQYVLDNATQGDPQSILDTLDEFGWQEHWMMFVGPEKGEILDAQIDKLGPNSRILELG